MVDNKDLAILELLKRNSKLSVQRIARKTGIPATTVHNRIKKLAEGKVIKKYTISLDEKKLGRELAAYILVVVDYKLLKEKRISQHRLAANIKHKFSFVEEACLITGTADIIFKVRVKGVEELNNFVTNELRSIDGIEKTQTSVILSEIE